LCVRCYGFFCRAKLFKVVRAAYLRPLPDDARFIVTRPFGRPPPPCTYQLNSLVSTHEARRPLNSELLTTPQRNYCFEPEHGFYPPPPLTPSNTPFQPKPIFLGTVRSAKKDLMNPPAPVNPGIHLVISPRFTLTSAMLSLLAGPKRKPLTPPPTPPPPPPPPPQATPLSIDAQSVAFFGCGVGILF